MAAEIRSKLKDYIINRERYPHIPRKLDGMILLEEVKDEEGRIKGWITIAPETLADLLHRGKNMRDPAPHEFEEVTGLKKYLDEWRAKGIDI